MQMGGVVAEFNPWHRGHAALIQAARERGVTHVVAVMSGNFVQRGMPAIAEKRVRARCALLDGVDLVLELPVAHATATAQRFALGAVGLLSAAGCVDTLLFGSESGELTALQRLAALTDDPALQQGMAEHLRQGVTWARARQLAAEQLLGEELAGQLASPNNALAVEYLRAALLLEWQPELFTLRRQGAAHDAGRPRGGFASASWLRGVALRYATLGRYMPSECVEVLRAAAAEGLYPADLARLERAVLTVLRGLPREELADLPDLSEGLENRLYGAIRTACSLEELYVQVKSKRYTLARVRRLVLHAFLGITQRDLDTPPPYLRVLGMGERGREVLGRMKQTAVLPVDTRLARLRTLGPDCARFAALEEHATDLYTLALPVPRPCGYDPKGGAVYLK